MPPGWFIHKFTAITTMAPKTPLAAIGTLLQMCAQQRGLVQFRIAAHHQHPALMCPDSLQKTDEHVTFAMSAYEPYGGPCQREGIAIGLGPDDATPQPCHGWTVAGLTGWSLPRCQSVFVRGRGPQADPKYRVTPRFQPALAAVYWGRSSRVANPAQYRPAVSESAR